MDIDSTNSLFLLIFLQKVGETPGSTLADAQQHLNQAEECLSIDSSDSLKQQQRRTQSKFDTLRREVKTLNLIKHSHEKLLTQERNVSSAAQSLSATKMSNSTRAKIQQATTLQGHVGECQSAIQEVLQSLDSVTDYPPATPVREQAVALLDKCSTMISELTDVKQQGDKTMQTTQRYSHDMQVCS